MKLGDREPAVSPVIGTILLVAITVVLVAIIAAVIMGMVGGVGNHKNIGLTVEGVPDVLEYDSILSGYVIRIYGGDDVQNLRAVNMSVENANATIFIGDRKLKINEENPQVGNGLGNQGEEFGSRADIPVSALVGLGLYYLPLPITDNTHPRLVTVTGTFSDGTRQVLYKGMVEVPLSDESKDIGITEGGDENDHLDYDDLYVRLSNFPQSPVLSA
jgi:flagellin-like protein